LQTFAYESRRGLNFGRKLNFGILSSYVVLASNLLVKKIEKELLHKGNSILVLL